MFKKIFGSSSIIDKIIMDENPNKCNFIIKDSDKRKKMEDIADDISPVIGKTVRTINNLNDTIENHRDSIDVENVIKRLLDEEVKDLELADHLFVQRVGYTHHGIYIGNGQVIHYLRQCVCKDTLEVFADGAKIHKKSKEESYLSYSKEDAINRAYSRLYEDNYNLFKNNCENFVRWCRNGGEVY